ncbi:AtpZ/AtpI family protein [Anoxynatronum buryatiense]|uniref:F0F1-ATPase subunit, putative n=1 Tax=Anoxynatronum buryatiense TaxID=489973 RepID=A0AA46AIP0_9CLOT|nr:AtpZ/AtpI family protein [Anoxynatronum buryatiense]SMP52331.1 F0F1-ATPase subunit, putative [Anoxynatronum buryatiense]
MKRRKGSALQNLSLISYIGIAMVVPILAGVVGGRWLDERFGTKPVFLFILIVAGVLIGARNVYQLAMKDVDPPRSRRRE